MRRSLTLTLTMADLLNDILLLRLASNNVAVTGRSRGARQSRRRPLSILRVTYLQGTSRVPRVEGVRARACVRVPLARSRAHTQA